MSNQEGLNYQIHEKRMLAVEERVHDLESTQSTILQNQAVTNERLSAISRQLENGIKSKLEKFDKDMSIIMPLVINKAEMEKTIRNAIIILAVGGAGSLFIFVLKLFFLNGQ